MYRLEITEGNDDADAFFQKCAALLAVMTARCVAPAGSTVTVPADDMFPASEVLSKPPGAVVDAESPKRRPGRPPKAKESQPAEEVKDEPPASSNETSAPAEPTYTVEQVRERVQMAIKAFTKRKISDADQVAKMRPLFEDLGSKKGVGGLPVEKYAEFMERSATWLSDND